MYKTSFSTLVLLFSYPQPLYFFSEVCYNVLNAQQAFFVSVRKYALAVTILYGYTITYYLVGVS